MRLGRITRREVVVISSTSTYSLEGGAICDQKH